MSLRWNIAANYLGKLWSIASIYAFVPLYIRLLGIEAYGVIAFQGVILAIVWIADAGLAPAFSREAARRDDLPYLRDVLCAMERVYLSICAAAAVVLILCSEWIATSWLKAPEGMDPVELRWCLVLMAVGVASQLAMSLYVGGLMGRQRQAYANGLQIAYGVFRAALVLLPLLAMPRLSVYFAWQAFAGLLFLGLIRRALWRELRSDHRPVFSWQAFSQVHKFAAGMFGMAIVAALNTQVDKLVTSSLFSLSEYAVYSIAALVAQAPSILTLPIAVAVLPRMTALVEKGDLAQVRDLYRRFSLLIATTASAVGCWVMAYAEEIVLLWTRDAAIASQARVVVQLLTAGGVCLALQFMPYHLSLANGHSTTNLRLGLVFLIVTPVLTLVLAQRLGLAGAAWPWIFMNATALLYLGRVLTVRFLPGVLRVWALHDMLVPLLVTCAVVWAGRWLTAGWTSVHGFWVLAAGAFSAVAAAAGLLLYRRACR